MTDSVLRQEIGIFALIFRPMQDRKQKSIIIIFIVVVAYLR